MKYINIENKTVDLVAIGKDFNLESFHLNAINDEETLTLKLKFSDDNGNVLQCCDHLSWSALCIDRFPDMAIGLSIKEMVRKLKNGGEL